MLHALAQPSQAASHQPSSALDGQQDAFHRSGGHQHKPPPPAPPGAALSSTAIAHAAISAYLSGAASIVFSSQQAAADYQAAAVARAAASGAGGIDDGLAWRQARAIEALLLQSGQPPQQQLQQAWPLGGWQQQQQQSFYGAALQSLAFQQQQQQQQAFGLMQQPMLHFGSNRPTPAFQRPAAGASSYGLSNTSSASAFVAAALSPPATTPRTCSSSGDSAASSPLLSVASLSSSTARGGSGLTQGSFGGPPTVYSETASTGDPFDLAPSGGGTEGLEFKDLFGFSPAVSLGGSFAAGMPTTQQQQQQQQQQSFNECVSFLDLACCFDPPGPDDALSPVASSSVGTVPYVFNALPADAVSGHSSASPASTGGSSDVSPPASTPAKQPTQAELAKAEAAHFAWNQSVNLREPKKRHVCAVCARGFARAFNLKSHMATHDQNRPKPFTCPHAGCARGFSRSHDLERHRVGIHQGESSTLPSAGRFKERYAHARPLAFCSPQDVGDDLGLAGDSQSMSGSSTASSSYAQASKHTAAQRAKKRSIRGVSSAA